MKTYAGSHCEARLESLPTVASGGTARSCAAHRPPSTRLQQLVAYIRGLDRCRRDVLARVAHALNAASRERGLGLGAALLAKLGNSGGDLCFRDEQRQPTCTTSPICPDGLRAEGTWNAHLVRPEATTAWHL